MGDESSSSALPQKSVHWQEPQNPLPNAAPLDDKHHPLLRVALEAIRAKDEMLQFVNIAEYLVEAGGSQAWQDGRMPDFFCKRHLFGPSKELDLPFWRTACEELEIITINSQESEEAGASFYGGPEHEVQPLLNALLDTLWQSMPYAKLPRSFATSMPYRANEVKRQLFSWQRTTYHKVCCPAAMPAHTSG